MGVIEGWAYMLGVGMGFLLGYFFPYFFPGRHEPKTLRAQLKEEARKRKKAGGR